MSADNRGASETGRMEALVREQQARICRALEGLDGARFKEESWERPGGGGGLTAILSGDLFEKAGVNTSAVWGELDDAALGKMASSQHGLAASRGDRSFFATGLSMVLHPKSPMVPTMHANFRYLTRGGHGWFGGGADLTPYYPTLGEVAGFHRAWKAVCDRHDPQFYPRFKRWCDEYFYLPHRAETRGVGGIFFDDLVDDEPAAFAFVEDCCRSVLDPYVPIVQRRRGEPYGDRERRFQLFRRGRYVEFNLVYDRGTSFGLATGGRAESILMSLPPLAAWLCDDEPSPDSAEAQAMRFFQPRDWLAEQP